METRRVDLAGEIKDYFDVNVRPIYSKLIANILKNRPEDILEFSTKWFKDKKGASVDSDESSCCSSGDEQSQFFQSVSEEKWEKMKEERLAKARKNRYGISSEKAFRGSIKVQKCQKKQQKAYMRILFFCMNSFLFQNFSQRQVNQLIQMMKREQVESDRQICRQGEYGDRMYFVDEGLFQCVQQTDEGKRSLRLYSVGQTFGEICLLHMVRRQASIFSRNRSVVYSLDRKSYIHYKKMSMIKKRTLYMCTLMKIPIFKKFTEDNLQKVCDVFAEITYEQGDVVINEGDAGSRFYIVLDGILTAYKGKNEVFQCCFKEGDYFGELSLYKDIKRQASVKALTRCKLVYITRDTFKRIFQNVDIQKQIEERYNNKGNIINKRRNNFTQHQPIKHEHLRKTNYRGDRPLE